MLLPVLLLLFQLHAQRAYAQAQNQPPHFVPGSGDMSRFSLLENTPVGSPVYQLRGKLIHTVLLLIYDLAILNFHLMTFA